MRRGRVRPRKFQWTLERAPENSFKGLIPRMLIIQRRLRLTLNIRPNILKIICTCITRKKRERVQIIECRKIRNRVDGRHKNVMAQAGLKPVLLIAMSTKCWREEHYSIFDQKYWSGNLKQARQLVRIVQKDGRVKQATTIGSGLSERNIIRRISCHDRRKITSMQKRNGGGNHKLGISRDKYIRMYSAGKVSQVRRITCKHVRSDTLRTYRPCRIPQKIKWRSVLVRPTVSSMRSRSRRSDARSKRFNRNTR